jgi:hypothetical protein
MIQVVFFGDLKTGGTLRELNAHRQSRKNAEGASVKKNLSILYGMNSGCFYKLYAWNGEKIVYKRKVFGPPNYLATVYEVSLNLCHLLAVEEDRSIDSSYLLGKQ